MKQKVVAKAIIKQDDKILLLRRQGGRPSIRGLYELPSGRVFINQQPKDALANGLKVHLGLELMSAELTDVMTYIDPDDRELQYVFIIFEADANLPAAKILLSKEYDKFVQKSLSDIQLNDLTQSTQQILKLSPAPMPKQAELDLAASVDEKSTEHHLVGYSDGGSRGNPGIAASGYVLMDADRHVVSEGGAFLGVTTNNIAEYQGLKLALESALELGAKTLDMNMDSELVVNQMKGIYKVKNKDLLSINQQIHKLLGKFEKVNFNHVLREYNSLADGIVNKVLDEVEAGQDVPVYGKIT